MNIFTKTFNKVKEAIDKTLREQQLRSGYKAYIAEREERINGIKLRIEDKITKRSYSFSDIVEDYEDLKCEQERIELANETLRYIFDEEKKAA